jgi:putative peptidoglycan lipid II flippase
VFVGNYVEPGIKGACYGATVGAFIGNILIPYWFASKRGLKFKFEINFKHEGAVKVFKLMLPVVLGLSLPAVFDLISQSLASPYPAGTNAILTAGNQLMQAPLGLFGQSLGLAIFPVLTKFFADGRIDLFREQVQKTLRTVVYLAIPTSVMMAVMADQVAASFFLHGKAEPEKVLEIAVCLRILCIGIWAWCMHPILMRAYYSLQNTITPIVIGTATTGVFYVLAKIFMTTSLGYKGLPLAGSIAPMLMVGGMLYFLQSKLGGFDYKGLIQTLGKSAVASLGVVAVTGLVAWTPFATYLWGKQLQTLGVVLFAFCLAIAAYHKLSKWMAMPETAYMDRAMARMPWNKKPAAIPADETPTE